MMTSIQDVAPFVNITDLSIFQEHRRLKVIGN